jgi:hypothetical protein
METLRVSGRCLAGICRLRDGDQLRPLVSRPHRHAYSGGRGRLLPLGTLPFVSDGFIAKWSFSASHLVLFMALLYSVAFSFANCHDQHHNFCIQHFVDEAVAAAFEFDQSSYITSMNGALPKGAALGKFVLRRVPVF